VFVIKVGGRFPWFLHGFLVLVQDADAAILTYSVTDLQWVNPHGQLTGKGLMKEGSAESTTLASLTDDGVHLTIDSDTSVS